MTALVVIVALIALTHVADVARAPLKDHKRCRGRGHDSFCRYKGKVPKLGARWIRPDAVEKWRA